MKYLKLLGVAVATVAVAEFADSTDFAKKLDADALAKDPTMTGSSWGRKGVKYGAGAVALVVSHRLLMGGGGKKAA